MNRRAALAPMPSGVRIQTTEEIISRHAGNWVLMEIHEVDAYGWPVSGSVVGTSSSREDIWTLLDRTREGTTTRHALYPFFAQRLEFGYVACQGLIGDGDARLETSLQQ